MKKWINQIALLVSIPYILSGCREYTPKPHGYPRIEFPDRSYQPTSVPCNFQFNQPSYAIMIPDTNDYSESCWYNLFYPDFDATLHLSYRYFDDPAQLDSMTEDAFKLVFKHTIKAEEIDESEISNSHGAKGIFYTISGNTATPFNFYMSDQKHHFMRGAFYFNNHTVRDSVAPVVDFIREDMSELIQSLKFKN